VRWRRARHRAPAKGGSSLVTIQGAQSVDTVVGQMWLPSTDSVIRPILETTGVWETAETEYMRRMLRPGMTVVDVGAHCGYFTLLASTLVGNSGRVIAFEPSPASFELLAANVWRNGASNVTTLPWAVGRDNGYADLYLAEGNTGDHRLVETEDQRVSIRVRCVTLDMLSGLIGPADFLKVDTQGYEGAVLGGSQELLAASSDPTLTIEFWPFGLRRAGEDPRRFIQRLRDSGFDLTELDPFGAGPAPLDVDDVLARCEAGGDHSHTNLIMTRSG
jgi:FkbM family methyltransferase